MLRSFACAVVGLLILAAGLPAQEGIQRGKVKKVDADKGTITITADGKDLDFTVTDDTRIMGADGRDVKDRLKDKAFQPGAAVMFKPVTRDGKTVLAGIKFAGDGKDPGTRPAPEKVDTSKFKPLTELGLEQYQAFPGGLYPDGKNERPAAHEAAGLALAKKVQPLDADGKLSADGKVVLLSIGMSNTTQEFSLFKQLADGDKDKSPRLAIVDGAQGGMAAAQIVNPESGTGKTFWTKVDDRLKTAGATATQVQAVWLKQADISPSLAFPKHAQVLQAELAEIVQLLHKRFPNLRLVYLSSRTYGGYAKTRLNPEPFAYESGFAVKWLIEQQLKGDPTLNFDPARGQVNAPWLSWGPYLWANGSTKRADGFSYEESDFGGDGTHPSQSGRQKVAKLLLQFFKSDTTTRGWFVRTGS